MAALEPINYPPHGTFRGRNFVTPEPVAYYRRKMRGRTVYVEISKGESFFSRGQTLYGVTFRYAGGGELWREEAGDPSACFDSFQDAKEHAACAK